MGIKYVAPKIHHGESTNLTAWSDLAMGWGRDWKSLGLGVMGWGWVEGDPVKEAELAVRLCTQFDLDGYICDAEDPYEGIANAWKSRAFVKRFRELAPRAPLALSYIGAGYPYRQLDFGPWIEAGAVLMPQCYWSDAATSIQPSVDAADRLGQALKTNTRELLVPTVGTSSFQYPYPADRYRSELNRFGFEGYNVWLLESTTDDYLRTLLA